ncbi:MAG: YihY/virulence factor BrkB family protein [Fusobacteriaceae bacterium]
MRKFFEWLKNSYSEFVFEGKFSSLYPSLTGAYRNYKRSNSNLWVSTLCYLSITSLAPLLAIFFSVGAWLGMDKFIQEQMIRYSPINEETMIVMMDAVNRVLKNAKSGVATGVGIATFAYVIISMFSSIEKSFNGIWRIKKMRSFARQFPDYMTITLIFPLALISINIFGNANGLIYFPKVIRIFAPYLGLWFFFTVFYRVMPNTEVKLIPCMIAGFFVSLLLNQTSLIFTKLSSVIAAYNALYGSFSVVLIFLIWLRIIWTLVLIGAHLTYILQNRRKLIHIDGIKYLNFESRFKLAVVLIKVLFRNFLDNEEPLTIDEICERTGIPYEITSDILNIFKDDNLVTENLGKKSNTYKLAVNFESFTFGTLYESMKKYGEDFHGVGENDMDLTIKIRDTIR